MDGLAAAQNSGREGFGPSAQSQSAAKAQTESATSQVHVYLSEIGYKLLAERANRVAAIATKEQAISRKDEVRVRILHLVGGIPASTGPINAKVFDSINDDGFNIENIAYESCQDYQQLRLKKFDKLTVTPTGQSSTSLKSHTVEAMARRDATKLLANPEVISDRESLMQLQSKVRTSVRQLAGRTADETQLPKVTSSPLKQANDYRTESLRIESEPGIVLRGVIGIPNSGRSHPAIVWMDPTPVEVISQNPEFTRLLRAGSTVIAFHPRDVLGEPQSGPEQLALGQYVPELLRAIVVGKTIVGMRIDDVVRVVNWAITRGDVDPKKISLYGKGGLGMVALHAAAVDERIGRLILENSLLSYRTALDAGLHKNLSEIVIPGVLTRYDTPQLMQAIFPRPIFLINPANAIGHELRIRLAEEALSKTFATDRAFGQRDRIKLFHRGPGDPLPFE